MRVSFKDGAKIGRSGWDGTWGTLKIQGNPESTVFVFFFLQLY